MTLAIFVVVLLVVVVFIAFSLITSVSSGASKFEKWFNLDDKKKPR